MLLPRFRRFVKAVGIPPKLSPGKLNFIGFGSEAGDKNELPPVLR